MRELVFENELIRYLSGESIEDKSNNKIRETGSYIVKTKKWKYEPYIKTTEALWKNFKEI